MLLTIVSNWQLKFPLTLYSHIIVEYPRWLCNSLIEPLPNGAYSASLSCISDYTNACSQLPRWNLWSRSKIHVQCRSVRSKMIVNGCNYYNNTIYKNYDIIELDRFLLRAEPFISQSLRNRFFLQTLNISIIPANTEQKRHLSNVIGADYWLYQSLKVKIILWWVSCPNKPTHQDNLLPQKFKFKQKITQRTNSNKKQNKTKKHQICCSTTWLFFCDSASFSLPI